MQYGWSHVVSQAPPESLHTLLAQVCRAHHARVHALLETLGLYRGQPFVLYALWKEEGLAHSELAERLHVQPATITKMLQRMEKAGFVVRRHDSEDRRVSRVYLTDAGHAIRSELENVWQQLEREAFAGLDTEERAVLRQLLLRVWENLMQVSESH